MKAAKKVQKPVSSNNRPTHTAYTVRQIDETRSVWRPIGAAWTHADNKGLTVTLNVHPIDGRITLRVNEEKKEEQP